MRNALLIIAIYLSSCGRNKPEQVHVQVIHHYDTIIKHDTIFTSNNGWDWQEGFGLTHDPKNDSIWGKPVKYYLDEPGCSGIAFDFYYGSFRPTDSRTTADLLKLACTDNKKLRPFYRWCLNKTILIQDGALAEYTGEPARRYAETFPKEFFEYMDSDTSGAKYKNWVESIIYSGFYGTDNYKKPDLIRKNLVNTMKRSCRDCNPALIKRIEKFGADCFALKK